MNNDNVLPCIAGHLLMVAISNGLWLLVLAGFVIIKVVQKEEQKG